ncbi:hydantoinase/oxoprolinase family protein [Methylotenera sp. 1P/1]|uniref:hydantoinase/oxoprolinase family protein n=1 Tax=Methylotenera sp. 1P/1 TaxID=1131551 RepID=UPI00036EBE70|nr:hydantoinase/oxoprolinase family protein [Methylotenera sp. 1P/1]
MCKDNYTIGWDIGGAHIKAALVDAQGLAHQVYQLACPLWRGPQELVQSMAQIQALLPSNVVSAVTMTGELVDYFPNRHTGVCEIARVVHAQLGADARFYAGETGWLSHTEVESNTGAIASMNWHASAAFIAQTVADGLFVDIGSTTTDVIPIQQHGLLDVGCTDAQRMAHHGLIYTGIVRTPLMALGPTMMFNHRRYYVAAEYFATSADVYRLLEQLPAEVDLAETADGKDRSPLSTARRLARMIGHDVEDATLTDWKTLAQQFKQTQKNLIMTALNAQLTDAIVPIVGVGIGTFLCRELADELQRPFIHGAQLVQAKDATTHQQAVNCFPAYAVARLAA